MDLANYKELAMRTKPHPDPDCDYLELARIGMVGELGEIAELLKKDKYGGKPLDPQALLKEAGDLLWYMALYSDMTGYTFDRGWAEDHFTVAGHLFEMMRLISALVNADSPFRSTLSRGIGHLERILNAYGFTIFDATALNIHKLKRRYPEGFTLELASSHDSQ
jgi:hypothetical protein